MMRHFLLYFDDSFEESEHPRGEGGKFTGVSSSLRGKAYRLEGMRLQREGLEPDEFDDHFFQRTLRRANRSRT